MKTVSNVTKECGCTEKVERIDVGSHGGYYTVTTPLTLCNKHEEDKKREEQESREFNIFPTSKSKILFNILDKMIDEISDTGVDVSYFPPQAREVLKKYAIKIDNLK